MNRDFGWCCVISVINIIFKRWWSEWVWDQNTETNSAMTWTNFEKRRGEKLIAWKILWWWWWLLDKQHWMYKRLALYLANLTHADHGIVLSQLIFLICLSWPSYHCFHSQCLHVDTIIPHQESRIFHKSSLIFYHLSANQCCQYLLKWIMQNTNAIKYIFLREYWCLWCWLR